MPARKRYSVARTGWKVEVRYSGVEFTATVTGHSRKDGKRIVLFANGRWCWRSEIVKIFAGPTTSDIKRRIRRRLAKQKGDTMSKLEQLAKDEGFKDPMDLIEANHTDSVVPGICMREGCNYSTGVEPDQSEGWCEACEANTVKSCLILAGIM